MQKPVCGQLTLFPADFPASPFLLPGSAEAVRMTVTSGRKCLELSRSCGPLGWLEKMLLESSTWRSTLCWLTWKCKATKQGRLYFRLAPSTPRTGGTGAPLWPTPAARDCKGANSMEHLQREGRRSHADQLANAVKLWPTPTGRSGTGPSQTETRQGGMDLQTAAVMFPTPTTGAGLCGGTGNYQQLKALEADGTISTEERRSMAAGNGGQLNPEWVEAMMGFPPGWTELEPDGQMEAGRMGFPGWQAKSQTGQTG